MYNMSDFYAELRATQIPTVCADFNTDPDDFIAEIRPHPFNTSAPLPLNGSHMTDDIYTKCTSDEYVADMLSTRQFSNDKLTQLLHDSIVTLVRKLLLGRDVCKIKGSLEICSNDESESPLFVELNVNDSKSLPVLNTMVADIGDLNIRMRDESINNNKIQYHDVSDILRRESVESSKNNGTSSDRLSVSSSPVQDSGSDRGYASDGAEEEEAELSRSLQSPGSVDEVPHDHAFCPSTDDMKYALLSPELRTHREMSCEKSPSSSISDPENLVEMSDEDELDNDENSALVIDESYDADKENDTELGQNTQIEASTKQAAETINVHQQLATDTTSENKETSNAEYTPANGSELGSTNLPVDLSGDSEYPSGVMTHQAEGVAVSTRNQVFTQMFTCPLCPFAKASKEELSQHARHTHGLFTCTECCAAFTINNDLLQHRHTCSQFAIRDSSMVKETSEYKSKSESTQPGAKSTTSFYFDTNGQRAFEGTKSQNNSDRDDSTYGQLLDLSMKKKTTTVPEYQSASVNVSNVNHTNVTESEPKSRDVSSDGYGRPRFDNVPFIVRDIVETQRSHNINSEKVFQRFTPIDGSYLQISAHVHPGYNVDFANPKQEQIVVGRKLLNVPLPEDDNIHFADSRPRSVEQEPSYRQRFGVMRSKSILQGRPLKASPYSREKLTELAQKFLISRKASPSNSAANKVPSSCMPDPNLKHRVSVFVKSGGHHSHKQEALNMNPNKSAVEQASTNEVTSQMIPDSAHAPHRRSTSGLYLCKLSACSEKFISFDALERHSVEVHGRYLCMHCDKSFTARPNRDRHVRYHTGERPYKCDICPKAFFRGDDLKYHRTTRHPGAEQFACRRCDRSFTWNRDLEKHMKSSACKAC